jgi:DNA-binding transcriptional MerR regulator
LEKSSSAFRTISEVAAELDVPKHVLRFWEGKFPQLKPMKRGGGRRYYRPEDVELLRGIRWLLYSDGYTIKGVQRILRDSGVKFVKLCWRDDADELRQQDAEPVFEIPNLAAEAASAARRPARISERTAAQPKAAPSKAVQARGKGHQALTGEQKALLESLLHDLEECRSLLATAVEAQQVAQKPKAKSTGSRRSAATARQTA